MRCDYFLNFFVLLFLLSFIFFTLFFFFFFFGFDREEIEYLTGEGFLYSAMDDSHVLPVT